MTQVKVTVGDGAAAGVRSLFEELRGAVALATQLLKAARWAEGDRT